jgi:hypothetical protein
MNAAKRLGKRDAPASFTAELSLIPESTRAMLRDIAPRTMEAFDQAHPAYAPFPAPANPGRMPADGAGRRAFLTNHLDAYLNHERTFDRGSATHGRGHVARAFICASAMCSILEAQGISVDRNAVLCGITGHDVGRENGGADMWEAKSAGMTVGYMRDDFGADSMGADYEQAVIDSITKRSGTAEMMVFKSADSLDIGRTKDLDLSRMPFLRGKAGEKISQQAIEFREQLAKEANLLQRLTDPKSARREELNQILIRMSNPDSDVAMRAKDERDALLADVAAAYERDWELSADAFMKKVEDVVLNNPNLFPVLSNFYRP